MHYTTEMVIETKLPHRTSFQFAAQFGVSLLALLGWKNVQKNKKLKKNCKLYLPKHSISLRIFSGNLYSGYRLRFCFFFLDICTRYQTTLRGKQHHYTPHCAFNPYVPTQSPCTIHRTQQPSWYFPTLEVPRIQAQTGRWTQEGGPCRTGSYSVPLQCNNGNRIITCW